MQLSDELLIEDPAPSLREVHTTVCCAHPYYGFVCTPNSTIDFSRTVSRPLAHPAVAHIDQFGFRNRDRPVAKPAGEVWIGLFGGSVAFSVASTGNETTIAGLLERELNLRLQKGSLSRVRVLNFALPAGQQPQQLIIFALNLAELDGAITFDGVNEAVIPAYYNKNDLPPTFPYRSFYQALFARDISEEQIALSWMLETENRELQRRQDWLSRWVGVVRRHRVVALRERLRACARVQAPFRSLFPKVEATVEERVEAGAHNWFQCLSRMRALGKAEGVDSLFVLQPVPERGKQLTDAERGLLEPYRDVVAIRERAYPHLAAHLRRLTAEGAHCADFSNVFAEYAAESIYVDLIHFDDRGCEVVAHRMAEIIMRDWGCLNGVGRPSHQTATRQ